MLSHESFLNLIHQLDDLIVLLERHPDDGTREQVTALLSGLDALHREGLRRLVDAVHEAGGQPLLDRIAADPVVRILLGLYDLADLELPEEGAAAGPVAFVPLDQVAVLPEPTVLPEPHPRAREPQAVWVEVAQLEDLPPGSLRAAAVDDLRVLLVRVDGEVYAYRNTCPGSNLPLDEGRLEGHELVCPWHNCRFDARTGRAAREEGQRLEVYPVAVRGASVQLARPRPAHDANGLVARS